MEEISQEEKELIVVCLGNSLVDDEQSDIHSYCASLYEKLRTRWLVHPDNFPSAKQIEQLRREVMIQCQIE